MKCFEKQILMEVSILFLFRLKINAEIFEFCRIRYKATFFLSIDSENGRFTESDFLKLLSVSEGQPMPISIVDDKLRRKEEETTGKMIIHINFIPLCQS